MTQAPVDLKPLEQQIRLRSFIITVVIMAIIAVIVLFINAVYIVLPIQPEREEYSVLGTIDFGNMTEGSANVNTTAPPSPNPSENSNTPTQHSARVVSSPTNVVTGNEPSPVSRPSTPNANPTQAAEPTDRVDNPMTLDNPGGSNDGEGNNIGNAGVDGAPLTNGNGLMWGEGTGRGRRLINNYQRPVYDVNEEGEMEFELIILPNGTVRDVRIVRSCMCPTMSRRSIDKLKALRFNRVPDNVGEQRIRVKHKFVQEG